MSYEHDSIQFKPSHKQLPPGTGIEENQRVPVTEDDRGNPLLGLGKDDAPWDALEDLLEWLSPQLSLEAVTGKVIVLCWVLRPSWFKEKSLSKVAEARGLKKQQLHRWVRELRALSGNRFEFLAGRLKDKREKMRKAYHARGRGGRPHPPKESFSRPSSGG